MFKDWFSYVNQHSREMSMFRELAKIRALGLVTKDDAVYYSYVCDSESLEQLSVDALSCLIGLRRNNNLANTNEVYLYTKIFDEGPKVFRPTTFQLTMLEQMTINLPSSEYVQPFPTVIIDLPEGYYKDRSAILPQTQVGLVLDGHEVPEKHDPRALILHYDPSVQTIITCVIFSTGMSIKSSIGFRSPDLEIEEILNYSGKQYAKSMEISEEENQISNSVVRAGINYCLLLDEVGMKKVGPQNEDYYNRLREYRAKAAKRKDSKQVAVKDEEIKNHPVIYTLVEQDIELCRRVESKGDLPDGEAGGHKSPHHRRGHYRMQPCGPGNSLRKRIRVPAVFVNSHLFFGDLGDTKATYH